MLVLTRKEDESLVLYTELGTEVRVMVCRVDGLEVRLGLDAPAGIKVLRDELIDESGNRGTGNRTVVQ